MKYPKNQFKKLVKALKTLSKHIDNLNEINPSSLHFLVYQQFSEGQTHNRLVNCEGHICRQFYAEGVNKKFTPLFEIDNSFELYPNNTNDNNIETAIRKALKEI